MHLKEIMCGEDAAAARHSLDVHYPVRHKEYVKRMGISFDLKYIDLNDFILCKSKVENGIVKNWEDMEQLWNYTFYEKLQV